MEVCICLKNDFYSRPCGRGDPIDNVRVQFVDQFLLTPLREGRRRVLSTGLAMPSYFYSRPCGRGDA